MVKEVLFVVQQLQYAQKFPEPRNQNNNSGSDQDYRPPSILKRTANIGQYTLELKGSNSVFIYVEVPIILY
jgi:hypothetical protein